jgi:hypothetical protein
LEQHTGNAEGKQLREKALHALGKSIAYLHCNDDLSAIISSKLKVNSRAISRFLATRTAALRGGMLAVRHHATGYLLKVVPCLK